MVLRIILIDSKNILVGITDLNEDKIYLFKDNGELVKGFPIKGNSLIDIKFYLSFTYSNKSIIFCFIHHI